MVQAVIVIGNIIPNLATGVIIPKQKGIVHFAKVNVTWMRNVAGLNAAKTIVAGGKWVYAQLKLTDITKIGGTLLA